MANCRDCGVPFDPGSDPHRTRGYYNQCYRCAGEDVPRYLGRNASDSKTPDITIFRTDLCYIRAVLAAENRGGRAVNLPIGNPALEQARQGRREEEER